MLPLRIASRVSVRQLANRPVSSSAVASIHLDQQGGGAINGAHATAALQNLVDKDEHVRNTLAYCLSFSADESDFQRNFSQLDSLMEGQLAHCRRQRLQQEKRRSATPVVDTLPLPQSWSDVDRSSSRAIVVTESTKPFRIVSVNAAWEQLCGYKLCQARGKTLGSLLHGPATDTASGTGLIAQLLANNEAAVTLTNYKASGEAFRNRVRVGLMEEGKYFVGVLQQMQC